MQYVIYVVERVVRNAIVVGHVLERGVGNVLWDGN